MPVRFVISLSFLVALACPGQGAEFDKDKLAAIKPRMQKFVEDHQIAGAVTVVGTADRILHQEAVGQLRLEPSQEMSTDSIFRIASMTKPMTAAAILILADEGKLSVKDPVEKHLPEFRGQMLVEERGKDRLVLKKPSRVITLQDLLTHTSGLPPYPPGMADVYAKRNRTLNDTTIAVSQRPLDFEPGSRWSYCNSGIDVLGRVVEVVSGQSYETFMTKRIFAPLSMSDSTFALAPPQRKRLAGLYGLRAGKLVLEKDTLLGNAEKPRHPVPAGGLYSTGKDVARFYQMMLNKGSLDGNKILSTKAVEELTSLQTGELPCGFTTGMGFGLGFAYVRKPQGATAMLSEGSYGHGGAFGTQSWADPKKGVFMILLIQRVGLANGDASDIRKEFQRLAMAAIK